MKTMDEVLDDILEFEGGFTEDKDDTAHQKRVSKGDKWDSYCTNKGVTQFVLSDWLGRQATVDEVKELEDETVKKIFIKKFFVDPKIDKLPSILHPVMFDSSINHGPKNPCKWAQEITNSAGFGPITVDGSIGPKTINAVTTACKEMGAYFVNAFVERRIQFFKAIVANNPSQSKYLNGWIRRANSYRMDVD